MGTADGTEIAPAARAIRGRGRKEAELDRAIDDLERFEPASPVRVVDRDLVIGELPRRGRKNNRPRDRHVEEPLDREAVDHGLQVAPPPITVRHVVRFRPVL